MKIGDHVTYNDSRDREDWIILGFETPVQSHYRKDRVYVKGHVRKVKNMTNKVTHINLDCESGFRRAERRDVII